MSERKEAAAQVAWQAVGSVQSVNEIELLAAPPASAELNSHEMPAPGRRQPAGEGGSCLLLLFLAGRRRQSQDQAAGSHSPIGQSLRHPDWQPSDESDESAERRARANTFAGAGNKEIRISSIWPT